MFLLAQRWLVNGLTAEGCERIEVLSKYLPGSERTLPSAYVIPTYGRILALFEALYRDYRQRLVLTRRASLRCGDAVAP